MDLQQIVNLMALVTKTHSATATAALVLALIVYALSTIPWVKINVLTTPRRQHAATLFLAVAPAVVVALVVGVPWLTVLFTAILTTLAAVGVKTVTAAQTAAPPSDDKPAPIQKAAVLPPPPAPAPTPEEKQAA